MWGQCWKPIDHKPRGSADPPTMTFQSRRSVLSALDCVPTMLTMVGIPWEKAIYGFESVLYLAEHGKKLGVYEQRLGAGMVGCVDNLFRGQSHVHGHHHRS